MLLRLEAKFALATVTFLLFTDVLANLLFVQAYRTYTGSGRPKVQTGHSTLLQQFPMDTHRTLALQEPDRVRDAVLRRDAQAHVDVIRHAVPLKKFNAPLAAQVPQDRPYLRPHLPVE